LTVTHCTFDHNSANSVAGSGGAIYGEAGTVTVSNSTFTNNHANGNGGAIFNEDVMLQVINCTFTNNAATSMGGGIATLTGTTIVRNTLVASSAGGNCAGPFDAASTHNMADDNTCGASFTQKTTAEINFGPLAENGGLTRTVALQAVARRSTWAMIQLAWRRR